MTYCTVLHLIRCQIVKPFRKEPLHIKIIACSFGKSLCIPGPAKPFVTLRTVCRHIQEVASLSPEDIGDQLIQNRIRSPYFTGFSDVGIYCDSPELFRRCCSRKFVQQKVSETKERQRRMPGLCSLAADIIYLRFCTSVICIVEISFCIQNFSMKDMDPVTYMSVHGKLHISGDFLPEINDHFSCRCAENRFCCHHFLLPDLFPLLRNQNLF